MMRDRHFKSEFNASSKVSSNFLPPEADIVKTKNFSLPPVLLFFEAFIKMKKQDTVSGKLMYKMYIFIDSFCSFKTRLDLNNKSFKLSSKSYFKGMKRYIFLSINENKRDCESLKGKYMAYERKKYFKGILKVSLFS